MPTAIGSITGRADSARLLPGMSSSGYPGGTTSIEAGSAIEDLQRVVIDRGPFRDDWECSRDGGRLSFVASPARWAVQQSNSTRPPTPAPMTPRRAAATKPVAHPKAVPARLAYRKPARLTCRKPAALHCRLPVRPAKPGAAAEAAALGRRARVTPEVPAVARVAVQQAPRRARLVVAA